jgi:hypothetical protein
VLGDLAYFETEVDGASADAPCAGIEALTVGNGSGERREYFGRLGGYYRVDCVGANCGPVRQTQSGGPLFNDQNQVIKVTSWKTGQESSSQRRKRVTAN